MSGAEAEDDLPEPTELGRIVGAGTWLYEAVVSLRRYIADDPTLIVDLRWLVMGLEVGSTHLLRIGLDRETREPGGELFVGQQQRH